MKKVYGDYTLVGVKGGWQIVDRYGNKSNIYTNLFSAVLYAMAVKVGTETVLAFASLNNITRPMVKKLVGGNADVVSMIYEHTYCLYKEVIA